MTLHFGSWHHNDRGLGTKGIRGTQGGAQKTPSLRCLLAAAGLRISQFGVGTPWRCPENHRAAVLREQTKEQTKGAHEGKGYASAGYIFVKRNAGSSRGRRELWDLRGGVKVNGGEDTALPRADERQLESAEGLAGQ